MAKSIFITGMDGYIYTPSISLYVAKERTLCGETWPKTHFELQSQGLRMPTIHEFKEFLKYLKHDYSNRAEADSILDGILSAKSPVRAEWLDAKFEEKNGILYLNYGHEAQGNQLVAKYSVPLEKCLMKEKMPGIDMEDWLNNATSQGLPKEGIKQGCLYYWPPTKNHVARLIADLVGAYFDCDRDQHTPYSLFGVFACAEGAKRD